MPEAAIFYCGRALEVTSARAISVLNLEPGTQVFANLDMLERLACITRPALYLGHALRRLANDARHILRPLSRQDADFAALCLGPWLRWYMSEYFRGPKVAVPDQTFGIESSLATGSVAATLELLEISEATGEDVSDKLLALADEHIERLPALAGMVAEVLISCRRPADAQSVLKATLANVPEDLRLNQLFALGLRRAGHPGEAIAWLKGLPEKFLDDEETVGIMAGALKSCSEAGQGPKNALKESLELYLKGYQVSRERNLYLGVNAAALQLWQGDRTRSKELSARVVATFTKRNEQLAASGIDVARQRSYFDMVTEAEARLLATEGDAARSLYAYAFQRFGSSNRGDIEGTKHQANRSIVLLGGDVVA
jgi:hypothetical protein